MISYLYCNLIELYSKCIALILTMWYIGGSFGTRPCLVAYPTDYFWHRIQRISECVTVRVLVRVSPSVCKGILAGQGPKGLGMPRGPNSPKVSAPG